LPAGGARDPALRSRDGAATVVEVRERLVEQKDARFPDDRAPHRDALPLTAAESAGLAVRTCLQTG